MSHGTFLMTSESPEGLAPGLEGLPWWFIVIVLAVIVGGYMWISRARREAAERYLSRHEWEAQLKADDPDMRDES